MAINFNGFSSQTAQADAQPSAPQAQPAALSDSVTGDAAEVATPTGNSVDLRKGSKLDLKKRAPGLKNLMVGTSWDAAETGADFDLDLFALLLTDRGKMKPKDGIVYFNKKELPGIRLNEDNRTGAGDGDDETIDICLDKIAQDVGSIVFCVNIYDCMNRKQTFGMVSNSCIRLVDRDNGDKEICRFSLKDDYSSSTAVIFAELTRDRDNNTWKFEAIGEGKMVADLNGIIAMFS